MKLGDTLATNEWVEWHIHRFLDSDFVARMARTGRLDVIGAAVILWTASFKEDPAGTLPDDDILLADKAKVRDLDTWRELRPLVLHDWSPVVIEHGETGEEIRGRLGHHGRHGVAGRVTKVSVKSAHRRAGKAAGREAARMSVQRSRVKAKLKAMHRTRFADNADLVASVARWLDQNDLFVNEDNILAGLETLHNIPRVVHLGRGSGD